MPDNFQSAFTAQTIAKSASEWDAQRTRIKLAKALIGGTESMQRAGEIYLPMRSGEDPKEYNNRLSRSKLVNKYKQTLNYLDGQVFQKQVKYQEDAQRSTQTFDKDFFGAFQEDVDMQGTNLTLYCKSIFRAGMMDGIAFISSDYPLISQGSDEEGRTFYRDPESGEWLPRTAQADAENNWRPYWVLVRAEQVLDAWLDIVDGKAVLRAFRYLEVFQREVAGGERVVVECVRAIFPDHWEVWEKEAGSEFALTKYGVNALGIVPVDWFMPGEQTGETPGLTAIPTLDDLAHMNLAHWQAYSDHISLMQYGRAPVWLLNAIQFPQGENGEPIIIFGPGKFLASSGGNATERAASIESIGVNPASIDKSFQDLKVLEEHMSAYDLSFVMPRGGQTTATQMQIAAASSNSALKGWVQKLQDCMENALKKIALWQGGEDGPGLFINDQFVLPYDSSALQQLSNMVDRGQAPMFVLYELMKKMGMVSEDMTYARYTEMIQEDSKHRNVEFTPSFGSSRNDGNANSNQ